MEETSFNQSPTSSEKPFSPSSSDSLVLFSNGSFLASKTILLLTTVVVALFFLQIIRTWWHLKHIPGPLIGSVTNFQRVWWVTTRRAHLIHQEVHERYGDVVRVGPKTVIFSNPEAIQTVYPMRPGFVKGFFYAVLRPYTSTAGSLQAVFNTQDEALHKLIKNPIAPIFSVSSATTFESLVDDVLDCFEKNIDKRFVENQEIFDLGDWLQFFAFEVMGTMTFSKRYGFLDEGVDVSGMLGAIHTFMKTVAPIYWLDKILYKNRVADYIRRGPGLKIMQFVGAVIQERKTEVARGEIHSEKIGGKKDFLTRFLEIQETNKDLPPWASTAWTFSNVTAGSDSVGTVMRTTIYHLLSNPQTLSKLYDELRSANLTRPYPRYNEVRDLPYLEACVQEGIRMHPPFALPFERIVPEGGVTVLGYYLPAGTVVGGNPYVVNRHKPTFGQDAEFWRPERWLEKDEDHKKKLEKSVLTFGAGRRVCLGKHIGILEVKKLVSFLILTYDIHIIDPKAFTVENVWFFKQKGLFTQIRKRSE